LLLVLLPLLMTASAIEQDGSSGSAPAAGPWSCIGWPMEIAPDASSSPGVRRYRIKNRCDSADGRVAVFLFCDGRGQGLIFLEAGEEKIWSCDTGTTKGPGLLSIDPKSAL
jgi:hypothetical protein